MISALLKFSRTKKGTDIFSKIAHIYGPNPADIYLTSKTLYHTNFPFALYFVTEKPQRKIHCGKLQTNIQLITFKNGEAKIRFNFFSSSCHSLPKKKLTNFLSKFVNL